jgi:ribonuclease PH
MKMRVDGREPAAMRKVVITPHYLKYAEGSAYIAVGETQVICSATVENKVPPHLKDQGEGWITAEYAMLPRSSKIRIIRDGVKGYVGGRSYEIQRLIGRSLRSVVDLVGLGERTIIVDCDVVQADGGTRTAAITGGFVAMTLALKRLYDEKKVGKMLVRDFLAGVSVGIVEGRAVLDLCYLEDAQAEVDMNVVMTGSGKIVEVQGTAEKTPFSVEQMIELLGLAHSGIAQLINTQKEALGLEAFQ